MKALAARENRSFHISRTKVKIEHMAAQHFWRSIPCFYGNRCEPYTQSKFQSPSIPPSVRFNLINLILPMSFSPPNVNESVLERQETGYSAVRARTAESLD